MSIRIKTLTPQMIRVETQVSHSSRVAHTFWLFYKGHGNAEIPNLLNVLHICLKISLPLIRDRIGRAREVYFSRDRLLS